MEPQALALDQLTTDARINPRDYLDHQAVSTYRALYTEAAEDGPVLPPLEVALVGTTYVVVDGHHRLEAAKQAGLTTLPCVVTPYTRHQAFVRAVEANAARGVPFRHGDYARIIDRLLVTPETADRSSRDLARLLGCSHTYVDERRKRQAATNLVGAALEAAAPVRTPRKSPHPHVSQGVGGHSTGLATVARAQENP